jgi:hypothetical protein
MDRYVEGTSIASLVLAGVGLVGNLLCARLMLTTPMKPFSSALFMFFANVADSVVLVFEVVNDVALHVDGYDRDALLFGGNEWRCRVGVFCYEASRVVSAWAVVAMAAELTLATTAPATQRNELLYTRNRSFYISMAICLIAIAGCFPFLVIITAEEGFDGCSSKYKVFREVYSHVILHMFVNSVLPFVVIVACSAHSFYRLSVAAEAQRSVSYDNNKEEMKYQLPKAILSVSVVFVVSVLPLALIDLAFFLQRLTPDVTLPEPQWGDAHVVAQCVFLVNFSLKFYFVLFLEPQVRKGFSHILNCGIFKARRNVSSKYAAQSNVNANVNSIRGVRDHNLR